MRRRHRKSTTVENAQLCVRFCSVKGKNSKVFVCSGGDSLKDMVFKLAKLCNATYLKEFEGSVTHVIMETEPRSSRICQRSKKYFLGIAHHCWILNSEYVMQSLKAQYCLPEEMFEIIGDTVFPQGLGASSSRKTSTAEDIFLSLGGKLGGGKHLSLDETEEPNTVIRDWLFDSLSLFEQQDISTYIMNWELSDTQNFDEGHAIKTVSDIGDTFEETDSFVETSEDDEDNISSSESDSVKEYRAKNTFYHKQEVQRWQKSF